MQFRIPSSSYKQVSCIGVQCQGPNDQSFQLNYMLVQDHLELRTSPKFRRPKLIELKK